MNILTSGAFALNNSSSLLQAVGALNVGLTSLAAGTPSTVSLSSGQLSAANLSIASLSDMSLSAISANITQAISLYAQNTLSISSGCVISAGLSFHIYCSVYHLSSDSKLSPNPFVT